MPLEMVPLPVVGCFFGTCDLEEFLGGVWSEKLSVGTHISMKAPIYGGDFPPQVIGRPIFTTSENEAWSV